MSRAETPFFHLHTHSHYSLLEALPQIETLVSAAKADGQTALALTDTGNLYGAIDFYKECTKTGIKPILGADVYVAARTRHDKEFKHDEHSSRLVLLVENEEGYKNLLRLVSRSYLEGFFLHPRVDRELLTAHHAGLIAILPAQDGEVARVLATQQEEQAEEITAWYKSVFKDSLYFEITRHPEIPDHEKLVKRIAAHAKSHAVPLIASHEVYYMHPDDAFTRELVCKIKSGEKIDRDMGVRSGDFSFISQERAQELFSDMPGALANNAALVERCSLTLSLGKAIFPDYPIAANTTHDAELRKLTEAGLIEKNMVNDAAKERMNYELGLIASKGYSSYFLVVADLLREAAETGIYTNTRGSAAGSLVSYLCGITTVDPIEFNMPFERFLNPERPSAPDIDMDIADNRRDDLIGYARKKYGETHVVQLGTFGTMLSRAAVRDVARALGHSYSTGDMIAKMIPPPRQGFPVTIESALNEVPELREVYESDADAREIMDLAKKIEGNARHVGVHAAGVVIAPGEIDEYVPIQLDPKGGKTITQWDMYSIVDEYGGVGLLKFDFLGLKNLSVLADAVSRVKARLGITVDIANVALDDKKVYEMLTRGETLGVFQLASDGMTKFLMELEPTRVHDINAMVALYRPGPIAFIPDYIERKRDPKKVTYLDPRLQEFLEPTYGILIYQDDLLLIAVHLAGFSWGEADKLRKAVGKKIPELMAEQKEKFVNGCVSNKMKPAVAQQLWQQIETFAAYGFNKAHAVSYGNLAYKTAYMKANYPLDYMAALLTGDAGDIEQIGEIIRECVRMKITVLPPDINASFADFTVRTNDAGEHIRFGLMSIKNFGEGISRRIIEEREANGLFTSLADFLKRVDDKNLNKKSLESLIMAGALDSFGERGALLLHIELLLVFHKAHAQKAKDQDSLFGTTTKEDAFEVPPAAPATQTQRLAWEKELLGLYVSGHPLDVHKETLARQKMHIVDLKKDAPRDATITIAAFIESTHHILTKNGEKMCFVTLDDRTGTLEAVAFPRVYKEHAKIIAPGECVLVRGRISPRNGEMSFAVEDMQRLENTLQKK